MKHKKRKIHKIRKTQNPHVYKFAKKAIKNAVVAKPKSRRRYLSAKKQIIRRTRITPTPRFHRNLTKKQSLQFHASVHGNKYAITIIAKPDGQVMNYKVRKLSGKTKKPITAMDVMNAATAQGHRVF